MTDRWDYVVHQGRVGLVTMNLGGDRYRVRFHHTGVPKGQVREATVRQDHLREATDAEQAQAVRRGLTRDRERSRLPRH
jgi:hypothetical protein